MTWETLNSEIKRQTRSIQNLHSYKKKGPLLLYLTLLFLTLKLHSNVERQRDTGKWSTMTNNSTVLNLLWRLWASHMWERRCSTHCSGDWQEAVIADEYNVEGRRGTKQVVHDQPQLTQTAAQCPSAREGVRDIDWDAESTYRTRCWKAIKNRVKNN